MIYQNMDEARRERLSSISKVETVVAVKQQNKEDEEELTQLSITSADYNKLSEEVERLQKQLAGMDDSRRVYEAATKQLVSFLELVSSQLSVETMLENKQRLRERTRQGEFERSNRARMVGSRMSDIGLGDLGFSDLSIGGSVEELGRRKKSKEGEKSEGKRRVTVASGDSSSFRRQRGLRRRPVSVQGSPFLGKGSNSDGSSDNNDTVDSNNEQNNDSGKDSGRFTDSERGSPTSGSNRRRQLGARGAELVRQVRRFLGKPSTESSPAKTPVKGLPDSFLTTPDIPSRTLMERPSSTCTPMMRNVKREAMSPPSSSDREGNKENRNRVVIQLGSELPGWRGGTVVRQQERRKSFTSVPRRSRGSIETDSCGTVTVPVPFIQPPPGPWL